MYRPLPISLPLAAVLGSGSRAAAQAQVTSNLDDLPQAKTAPSAKKPAPTTHPAGHAVQKSAAKAPASVAAPPTAGASSPAEPVRSTPAHTTVPGVPPAPPPPVVLPPPFGPGQLYAAVPPADGTGVCDAAST
ncbi:MAG: hypothetical protein ABF727_14975, partial [Gluconobacter oxydans]